MFAMANNPTPLSSAYKLNDWLACLSMSAYNSLRLLSDTLGFLAR